MVRVIKHGKTRDEYEANCGNCGCVFAYENREKQIVNGGLHKIHCPECHYEWAGEPRVLKPTKPESAQKTEAPADAVPVKLKPFQKKPVVEAPVPISAPESAPDAE